MSTPDRLSPKNKIERARLRHERQRQRELAAQSHPKNTHATFIGSLSSLKLELSILIIIDTIIVFLMSWIMLKCGLSEWIAFPCIIIIALGITYMFSRGLTAQLREIRDAAEAVSEGDYQVRVYDAVDSQDEIGQLARSFNVMAEELEHSDTMRRDLIANVSHELRTPVAALQAQVENMADGITEPSSANLESILTQTQRLSDLIAFLLDLSRMEAGAASLEISTFNLSDFIDETVEPLEIADGGHNHSVVMNVPDIDMEGDQDRLRQLFTNIISNALKHSADGSEVLINAHEDKNDDTVVINVINYGSQIPVSARSDIFRRYVKGKGGHPGTESGGTGLGLPIARWAAQLHGGTVTVVDDPRGADFEIVLPKHHDENDVGGDGDSAA